MQACVRSVSVRAMLTEEEIDLATARVCTYYGMCVLVHTTRTRVCVCVMITEEESDLARLGV